MINFEAQLISGIQTGQDLTALIHSSPDKTVSISCTILDRIVTQKGIAIFVVPTKEFASHLRETLIPHLKERNLNYGLLIGGEPLKKQAHLLKRNPQLLITTPTRLVEHLKAKHIAITQCKLLYVDQVDRHLELGHVELIEKILNICPYEKQTIFTSKTNSTELSRLKTTYLRSTTTLHEDGISSIEEKKDYPKKSSPVQNSENQPKKTRQLNKKTDKLDPQELTSGTPLIRGKSWRDELNELSISYE